MKKILLSLLLLLNTQAYAHWEDPDGCYKFIKLFAEEEWIVEYEGVSEDGRDYIRRGKASSGPLRVEAHYILQPQAQWENKDKPKYHETEISVWLDWDGDGTFTEWYLDPRGNGNCEDVLHFVWFTEKQTYIIVSSGKEIL